MKIANVQMLFIVGIFILLSEIVSAQPLPHYELTVQHPVLIGTIYQFDIYIKRTGSEDFRIGNSQFILSFNTSHFLSPSILRVNASEGIGTGFFFDQVIGGNELRISLGGNGSYANAVDISASGIGTRISSYQVSGVNVAVFSPDLQWINLPALVRTGVSEIDASDNYRDITDQTGASHIDGGSEFARMAGYVFNDLNGNSVWDQPAEPALDGWTINISGPNGPQSATSGNGVWADGFYEFINLTPGQYTIAEEVQTGWSLTIAPTSPLDLASSDNYENLNFGNFYGPSVAGIVYSDRNGNGQKDVGEYGINGWEVVAYNAGISLQKTKYTNSGGSYIFTFSSGETGSWEISLVPVAGWSQTEPVSPSTYTFDIQSGTYETGVDFGSCRKSTINGLKFNDFTRDSERQLIEPGIEGWLVRLYSSGLQIDSTTTDSDGYFTFNSVTVGSFTVTESLLPGWAQTVPAPPGSYSVTIDTGGTLTTGLIFGNYHIIPYGGIGVISGVKFNDMNGNGLKEGGDPGISSWKIYLCIGQTVIDSVSTGINGEYSFINLDDGLYDIREEVSDGWNQTYPTGGTHNILLSPAQRTFTDVNFGNYLPGIIAGTAYYDINHNGTMDGTDVGMAGVTIRASWSMGTLETVTTPGGRWSFTGLQADLYTVEEDVPVGYHVTEPSGGVYNIPVGSGTEVTGLMFGNSAAADTLRFRTILYDSIAWAKNIYGRLGKSVTKKPESVEFSFELENISGGPTNGIAILFYIPLIVGDTTYPFVVTPTPSSIIYLKKDRYVQITWSEDIPPGGTVQISGWGKRGKYQRYSFIRWMKDGGWTANSDMVKLIGFSINNLKLPMPNPLNVTDEILRQIGFGWDGFVIGVERLDNPKSYGWVTIRNRRALIYSMRNRFQIHTLHLRKFDVFDNGRPFIKEQKRLTPTRQNNVIFANLLTLKINIMASELQITPPGLGELVYDDGRNPLCGLTLREIASLADTALTQWQGKPITLYESLDTTLSKINAAFNGPMDTVSFGSALRLSGVRPVMDVPFLHGIPGADPVIRIVDGRIFEEAPLTYALYQNYPNPFNPMTTIEFETAEPSVVTVKVFNILGQLVATLINNEVFEEGIQEIDFEASHLSSGVYFYTLELKSINEDEQTGMTIFRETKKMILMK